jgi:Tol biopolymer transport system component/DNA-binding winged helix-turn-helix (wHTH) protein
VDAPASNNPHAANVYAFGEFMLDVPARTLSRSGMGAVPLPSRAFDSLVYLVEHRERLVRKNELIDAVWHDVVVTDDSLIHAISVLRRALSDDPSNCHYVQTVPRRGYRFIAPVRAIPDPAAHSTLPVTPEAPSTDVRPWAPAAPPPARRSARRGALLGGVAVAAAATLALGIDVLSSRGEASFEAQSPASMRRAVRLFQTPPQGAAIVSGGVLSPDGESLTFVARDDVGGVAALWLRSLHSAQLERLERTDGASKPFWAPDSRRLGFFANGKLMTVDIRDGNVREVTSVGVSPAGGTWAPDGTILYADWGKGLYSVRASGAAPNLVAALDRALQDIAFSWPQFLPDGRHFLFQIVSLDSARTGVYVGDIDTRRSFRVLDSESPAVFAPPRHLLHVQHDMLIAEEFDTSTLRLTGRAAVLERGVSAPSLSDDNVVSAAGKLIAYRRGVRRQQLAWVDRAGEVQSTLPMPAVMFNPRVSPNGSHLLATSSVTTNPGLWLASLSRPEFERIETDAIAPVWSPDGTHIAFTARGGFDLLIRSFPSADSRRLISDGAVKILNDWSPDGDHIVYTQRDEHSNLDLWGVKLADGTSFPILATPSNELQARFSPDGRWIAYVADDSGELEVYVQRYPELRERHRVSVGGGGQPQWRSDQNELFYIAPDRALVAVAVEQSEALSFGAPRRLFRAPMAGGPDDARDYYATAADGGSFLVDSAFGDGNDTAITVVLNWSAEAEDSAIQSSRHLD